jgi:hypothetical protein
MSDHTNIAKRPTTLITKQDKFYHVKDLIANQGDIAIVIEYKPDTQPQIFISSYMLFDPPQASDEDVI